MRLSLKKCFAEFIGAFALVFAGTGAIVINDVNGGSITHVGIALTFGLMILAMIYALEKGITAGIAVGAVIGLEAMFAGPICGASMNPARSLAPAIVSGHLEHLWIYLTAPFAGAWLAIVACRGCQDSACCPLLNTE